jgi:hypothetical protein
MKDLVTDLSHGTETTSPSRPKNHVGQHFRGRIRHGHWHSNHPPSRSVIDVIADKHGQGKRNPPFPTNLLDGTCFV